MKFSSSFSNTSTVTLIAAFFFACEITISNNNFVVSFIAYQPTRPQKASRLGVVLFGDVKNEIVIDATPVVNGFDTTTGTGKESRREDKGSSSKGGTAKKMDKPFFVSIKPPNFGGSLKNSKNDNNGEEEMSEDELEQRLDKVSGMEKELEQRLSILAQLEERLASLNRRSNKLLEEQRRASAAPIDRPPTTTTASRVTDPAATASTTRSSIIPESNRPASMDRPSSSTSGSTYQSSSFGRDSSFTTSTDQQSVQDRSYSSINPIARSSDIIRSSSFDTNYIWNNNATVQNIKSIDKIWEALTPTTVRAGSQRTWVYENPAFERVLILLKTNDGNPLEADIKVQQGPSNLSPPLYMKVYGEDGSKRTFSAFLDTPQSPNTVTIKNVIGQRSQQQQQDLYTFVGPDKKAGDACLTTIRQKGVPKEILGGALLTYPIDSIVNSVAVLLKSKEGTPLNARIELLQGPINNNSTQKVKQVLEVYTEDVIDHPLLLVIQTPESDNTVQIVNTSPFPLRSTLVEYEVQRPIILSLLPLLLLVDFGIVASLFWPG